MFANFAAKRHLTGPLRAVSPVANEDTDIDWKSASTLAKKNQVKIAQPAPNANSAKLIQYFQKVFAGNVPLNQASNFNQSLQLFYVEAVSLLIPLTYIALLLTVISLCAWVFVEPMVLALLEEQYVDATLWACPAILSSGVMARLVSSLFGGFRSFHGRVLRSHEAPALMSLVDELSDHLNVKRPRRIEINNETAIRVDAFAGINSIYRDEYKIIIGAPLLMSLSLNELTAMLAHELSHFRDKQKKVAFYLMHHVSEWLYYRSSGQDKRHQALLKRMQKEDLRSYEFVELWFWQRLHILQQNCYKCMFNMHRHLTAWKSRQIELETDAVAISVVGSEAFTSMLRKLRAVQFSQTAISEQNDWAWKEGYLLADYAQAVAIESAKMTAVQVRLLEKNDDKEVTRFCPSDGVRIKQAKQLASKGLMTANVAGNFLLSDCKKISAELTRIDYESTGIEDPARFMISSEKVRQLKLQQDKFKVIAARYFDSRVDERIVKFEPTEERDIAQFNVQMSIDYIRRYRVEDRKQQASAQNLLKRIHKAYIIERLTQAKLPIKKYIKEDGVSRKDLDAYLQHMRAQYQQALYHMEAMDQVFYQRAFDAINYLDMTARAKVSAAFHNLELYCQVRREVASIEESYLPLSIIVNGLTHGASTRILQAGVSEKQQFWRLMQGLRSALKQRPIIVVLHGKRVHLLEYLDFKLGELPAQSEQMTVQEVAQYAHDLIGLLQFQYRKWQAQLSSVLTKFEHANDIEPVNLLR